MGLIELLLTLAIGFVLVIPSWRIVSKMGYPGAMGLLAFVPLVNLALVFYLAFATWPIQRRGGGRPA